MRPSQTAARSEVPPVPRRCPPSRTRLVSRSHVPPLRSGAAILALAATAVTVPAAVSAQVVGQEPAALRGITAVDPQVAVTWVEAITEGGGPSEAEYTEAFLASFQEGLTEAGVELDDGAPNYLYCNIALLYGESGLVSAAQSVEYHVPFGDEGQWAITWTRLQVFTVGLENFDGADDAQWCVQQFVEDWRAGNGGA